VKKTGTARILIVEDKLVTARAMANGLQGLGYEVTAIVSKGEEAIEQAKTTSPDLVLMDIQLEGGIDGIEAASRLRSLYNIPVVFVSGHADEARLERAREAEAFGYLIKPYNTSELHATISVALYKSLMEKKSREAHDEIERRVEERTAELRAAHDELALRVKELTAINSQTREIARFRSIDHLVSYTRKQLVDIIAPDTVIVYLLEEEGLILQGEVPEIGDFPEVHKIGECLCGLAARDGKTTHSVDIHSDPRCTELECKNAGLSSLSAVPLVIGETVIGVLAVGSSRERDFSEEELLLGTFAGQLAVGLYNAKLFEQLQTFHRELERRVAERTAELNEVNEQLKKKIADLRRTQKSLRESEERFRELAELLPQFVYEVDLNGKFTFLNRAALDEGGYTLEDLALGLSPLDMFMPEDMEAVARDIAEVLKGKAVGGHEYTVRRKDGTTFPSVSFSSPILRDGRVVGLRGVGINISAQKRAEEAQAQLIEEIKHFAFVVSHDLHAPLVNIRGFFDEVKAGLDEVFPVVERVVPSMEEEEKLRVTHMMKEDIPESLSFIDSSITHMNRLIYAVLEMSRAGRRELVFEPVNMNELVRETLRSLSYQIRETGVNVTVGTLPQTIADRTAMEQIVGNLLTNALKYLDPKRPGKIEITGHHFADENVFVVRDSGRGIDQSDLTRIFHMFQRSRDEEGPGEGMGLAYARALVRRHGGGIWCESEPGKGSTFTFTISDRLLEEDKLS
jgi:PAS domain S-box-containing protein